MGRSARRCDRGCHSATTRDGSACATVQAVEDFRAVEPVDYGRVTAIVGAMRQKALIVADGSQPDGGGLPRGVAGWLKIALTGEQRKPREFSLRI